MKLLSQPGLRITRTQTQMAIGTFSSLVKDLDTTVQILVSDMN